MDILAVLFPKEKKFYRMVEKQVVLVGSAVNQFHSLINHYEKLSPSSRKKIVADISWKEKEDDRLYTEMVRALKSTFITPIDREDLLQLVSTFDLIIDTLETVARKIAIFRIEKMSPPVKEQAEIIRTGFETIEKLIFSLRNEDEVEKYCLEMRRLEQKGDQTYIDALERLFSDSLSPIAIIKFKDLYSSLEKIVDKIHEASLIIENVAVKYS
ncbi:DUF47 family protein [Candidatus Roizmanbacteria bacterium]|nr:DUF47 family protein [Candidatus Roizmanbacteria bacterium]